MCFSTWEEFLKLSEFIGLGFIKYDSFMLPEWFGITNVYHMRS